MAVPKPSRWKRILTGTGCRKPSFVGRTQAGAHVGEDVATRSQIIGRKRHVLASTEDVQVAVFLLNDLDSREIVPVRVRNRGLAICVEDRTDVEHVLAFRFQRG